MWLVDGLPRRSNRPPGNHDRPATRDAAGSSGVSVTHGGLSAPPRRLPARDSACARREARVSPPGYAAATYAHVEADRAGRRAAAPPRAGVHWRSSQSSVRSRRPRPQRLGLHLLVHSGSYIRPGADEDRRAGDRHDHRAGLLALPLPSPSADRSGIRRPSTLMTSGLESFLRHTTRRSETMAKKSKQGGSSGSQQTGKKKRKKA